MVEHGRVVRAHVVGQRTVRGNSVAKTVTIWVEVSQGNGRIRLVRGKRFSEDSNMSNLQKARNLLMKEQVV